MSPLFWCFRNREVFYFMYRQKRKNGKCRNGTSMTTHVAFKVLSELNRTQKGFAYIQAPKAPTDIFGAPFTPTSLPPCAKRLIP